MNKEKPFDQRLDNKSRMNREVHVRFREGVGVKFPRATRLHSGFSCEIQPRSFHSRIREMDFVAPISKIVQTI